MIRKWLEDKRRGRAHSEDDIRGFIAGVLDGSVTRAQAAAWLAFVVCRGMDPDETVALTRAMTDSGERLHWKGIDGPFIDKHSTGGVGDKVSLVLAPLWAAMGLRVPMISGRGLGITGGTLDKLESIAGFRTDMAPDELPGILREVGCFMIGQTAKVAPADRVLYALRDETDTVESIPLITASILSKKLAEGIDRLVLDVKCGTGAFMRTPERARELADSLVRVGNGAGVRTEAHITDMNQPLGEAVGNALEVEEAVACLRGGGPRDLRDIVLLLAGEGAEAALNSGEPYERWCRMVRAQGGDPDAPLQGGGCDTAVFTASDAGIVRRCDAEGIGRAAFALGAGRVRAGEPVHFGVGLRVHARVGARVEPGQPLATLYHDNGRGLGEALALVGGAYTLENP